MNTDVRLRITEIQRFCMHDGPGVRTTVFLKGCPLRCVWCHNPETQSHSPQILLTPGACIGCGACEEVCPRNAPLPAEGKFLWDRCVACGTCVQVCPTQALEFCGKEATVDELLAQILRDRAFYGESGGVTLSGGEPFAQPEGALALLAACKASGISTVAETCGYFDPGICSRAAAVTDLFLFDVKATDPLVHRTYTGISNEQILSNLRALDACGARIRLRCILVKGVNDRPEHYAAVARLASSLKGCEGVDVLPYHAYGGSKQIALGLPDNGRREWIPSSEEVLRAAERMNCGLKA